MNNNGAHVPSVPPSRLQHPNQFLNALMKPAQLCLVFLAIGRLLLLMRRADLCQPAPQVRHGLLKRSHEFSLVGRRGFLVRFVWESRPLLLRLNGYLPAAFVLYHGPRPAL